MPEKDQRAAAMGETLPSPGVAGQSSRRHHAGRYSLSCSRRAHGPVLRDGDADHVPTRPRGVCGGRSAWIQLLLWPGR